VTKFVSRAALVRAIKAFLNECMNKRGLNIFAMGMAVVMANEKRWQRPEY
jgi:hypothetical protein